MGPGYGFGPSRRRRRSSGASPLSGYAWALDFQNGLYRNGGQLVTDVTALTGYNFARTGTVAEHYSGGAVSSFASGVPAIVPAYGYVQRPAHSNLLLNAGQASALATQDVTLTAGTSYTLSFIGTGAVTVTGAAAASLAGTGANDRVRTTVTAASTGAATFAVTGDVRWAMLVTAATQGPIIPTAGVAATAPAGDLWFTLSDLGASGDWLVTIDLDWLESNAAVGIEEIPFAISDGTNSNRIGIRRIAGGGQIGIRRNTAGGGTSFTGGTSALQPNAGKCILGLRKAGDVYTLGVLPTGGGYATGNLGTVTGWTGALTRIDIGKVLTVSHAHSLFRFVGLEAGSFNDSQMQQKLEARL